MPITPTAPDYVGQVRAIIGDLRDNYVKKQQLYLQEKEQTERAELARAQLNLQAQNAASTAQLARDRLASEAAQSAAQIASNESQYASQLFNSQRAALKEAVVQDREERRLQFDIDKEEAKLKKEREERDRETESGKLMQQGVIAMNSDDPTKLIEWTNLLAGSFISQKQRTDVYTSAVALVDAKRRLEIEGNNIRTQQDGVKIISDLNMMDVTKYNPDELADVIKETTSKFQTLKNTDTKLNDAFTSVLQDVAKRQNENLQQEFGKVYGSFLRDAKYGELDPIDQKAWDDIQREYPEGSLRSSEDYSDKTKRLMFQSNKRKSIEELQRMEARNERMADNLSAKKSSLAKIETDPTTGKQYRTFIFPTPDLTPRVGYNGTIDPNTGLLTKRALDENKKFADEITSPAFPFGSSNLMGAFSERGMGATEPDNTTTAAIPFKPNSATSFVSAQAPGVAKIPTASPAGAATISPETINNIVAAYRANSEAIIYGRPVREIIALLRAQGYSIPDEPATPEQTR